MTFHSRIVTPQVQLSSSQPQQEPIMDTYIKNERGRLKRIYGNCYGVFAKGALMIDDYIAEGDLLLFEPDREIATSDIIVASLNDQILVRQVLMYDSGIKLSARIKAANFVKVLKSDKFNIYGKVQCVIHVHN